MEPPMVWINDFSGFKMTLDFKGYSKEDIKVVLVNNNQIMAYGDRSKYPGFGRERTTYMFQIPDGKDPQKTSSNFDSHTRKLVISIPKMEKERSTSAGTDKGGVGQDQEIKIEEMMASLSWALDFLKGRGESNEEMNEHLVGTAVVALTFGLFALKKLNLTPAWQNPI